MNVFSLGAQIGGPDHSTMASASEQQLRDEFNRWKGEYSRDVREFAFLLRIDGEFHKYTEMWKIIGFQEAKCNEIGLRLRSAFLKHGGMRLREAHISDDLQVR